MSRKIEEHLEGICLQIDGLLNERELSAVAPGSPIGRLPDVPAVEKRLVSEQMEWSEDAAYLYAKSVADCTYIFVNNIRPKVQIEEYEAKGAYKYLISSRDVYEFKNTRLNPAFNLIMIFVPRTDIFIHTFLPKLLDLQSRKVIIVFRDNTSERIEETNSYCRMEVMKAIAVSLPLGTDIRLTPNGFFCKLSTFTFVSWSNLLSHNFTSFEVRWTNWMNVEDASAVNELYEALYQGRKRIHLDVNEDFRSRQIVPFISYILLQTDFIYEAFLVERHDTTITIELLDTTGCSFYIYLHRHIPPKL